jgi:hypothetical protein
VESKGKAVKPLVTKPSKWRFLELDNFFFVFIFSM